MFLETLPETLCTSICLNDILPETLCTIICLNEILPETLCAHAAWQETALDMFFWPRLFWRLFFFSRDLFGDSFLMGIPTKGRPVGDLPRRGRERGAHGRIRGVDSSNQTLEKEYP